MTDPGSPTPTAMPPRAPAPDPGGRRRHRPHAAHDPLLRGARPPRPRRPLGGRLPPVRRRGPRAPAVHPRPARRRGFSLAEIGQLLEDEARPRPQPRDVPVDRATPPNGARSCTTRSPGSTARSASLRRKIERLEAMIAEAEERRAHLAGHLEDLDAGREPTPRARGPPSSAMPPRPRPARRTADPAGRRLRARQRRRARSGTATTACSSAASSSASSAPGCSRSPRRGSSSSSPATLLILGLSPRSRSCPCWCSGCSAGSSRTRCPSARR